MKKFFMLLLISLIITTGCNIKQIDDKNIDKMIDTILGTNLNLHNQTSSGYKYYVPRGVRVIDSTSYNEKLYTNGHMYYLYVDVVSYHFKKTSDYKVNEKAYFSKKLDYNNKKGYLEINKIKNLYFVEMMYNYAKIEAFVSLDSLEQTVINASYILSSLKFNDTIIKLLFDEQVINFNEEQFKLFEPKRKEGDFLDYFDEYEEYEEEIDEDLITPDNSISGNIIDNSLE
ncbi:MAG: hypothetical protein PHI22_00900 [Bacilli bacterium]|nr:hypothetical protein [Bacilli bacterium]MDD4298135.1 hypothetical protein [Bacilli bacterium]MDD4643494.1 hypothetical protein [Bacilli bacterium]